MPSEVDYPTDGTVQGPCPSRYRYYGRKAGCSCYDCRPEADLAAEQRLATGAAPRTRAAPTTTRTAVAYLLPGDTTRGPAYFTFDSFEMLRRTAGENGWSGRAETWTVTVDLATGDEVTRAKIGEFYV